MAQHDMNIANQGFPAFRADLNNALGALVSNSSGPTAPATTFAHQYWVDTSANPSILKIRNADNDAFITIGTINQTGDTFTLTAAVTSSTATLTGGTINGMVIGGSTAAAMTGTTITANTSVVTDTLSEKTSAAGVTVDGVVLKDSQVSTDQVNEKTSAAGVTVDGVLLKDNTVTANIISANFVYASNLPAVGSFTWDTNTSSPAAATSVGSPVVTSVHAAMRRCLLNDSGVVQYYLNPTNSAQKLDGSASVLTGADGMVMVEIPKFYTRREVSGTYVTWSISAVPLPGFTLHPAFTKNGVEVNFRYYSAYDACYLDATDSVYKSGLNLDDLTSSLDLAADKLSSVSGVYPIVGVTRAECRSLATNRGSGWRQLDWTLWSAVQMLYLVEYQTFFSQSAIGNGNTRHTTWPGSSVTQTDSRTNAAGLSNGNGNATANSSSGTINTNDNGDYMSYRGIENLYGNVWNWADGVIVNPDGTASTDQGDWYFTNNSADFSDSVRTNMVQITAIARTGSGFISAVASVDNFFIATSVSGGSSTTFLTDQHFGSTAADRVVLVGGTANDGALAGAFRVSAELVSSFANRIFGARLAF